MGKKKWGMSLPLIDFLGQSALLQKSRVATSKSNIIEGTREKKGREAIDLSAGS
jgi:hypothetical protein